MDAVGRFEAAGFKVDSKLVSLRPNSRSINVEMAADLEMFCCCLLLSFLAFRAPWPPFDFPVAGFSSGFSWDAVGSTCVDMMYDELHMCIDYDSCSSLLVHKQQYP
jgi:hypothetical protein